MVFSYTHPTVIPRCPQGIRGTSPDQPAGERRSPGCAPRAHRGMTGELLEFVRPILVFPDGWPAKAGRRSGAHKHGMGPEAGSAVGDGWIETGRMGPGLEFIPAKAGARPAPGILIREDT